MEGAGRSGLTNQEMSRSEMQGAGQRIGTEVGGMVHSLRLMINKFVGER